MSCLLVPLLCRIYPNGQADINHCAAGGTSYLFAELFEHGLMHADAQTMGRLSADAGTGVDGEQLQGDLALRWLRSKRINHCCRAF